jgi:hypothetical protein
MKSLYESILSSTKSGATALTGEIKEWWEKDIDRVNKGNYDVVYEDGKYFIVIDDFENQPLQYSVMLNGDDLRTMPKKLSGIYKTEFASKGVKKGLRPVCLNIYSAKNRLFDLSRWDMTKGNFDSPLTLAITFHFCNNMEIVGLPKYSEKFNAQIGSGCKNMVLNGLKAPNCEFQIDGDDNTLNLEAISNCDLYSLFINLQILCPSYKSMDIDNVYKRSGRKTYMSDYINMRLDGLFETNDISVLKYVTNSSMDAPYIKSEGTLKIVKEPTGYCFKKFK